MEKKHKFYIEAFSNCGYRQLDAERFRHYFLENGHEIVYNPKDADYIILITCGFTASASKLGLDMIKKFQKYNAELIVAGCLPKIRPDLVAENFNGKIIFTTDLVDNPEKIDQMFQISKTKFNDIEDPYILEFDNYNEDFFKRFKKKFFSLQARPYVGQLIMEFAPIQIRRHILNNLFGEYSVVYHYFSQMTLDSVCQIRIGDGCSGNCAYCSIKGAIGPLRSKPIDLCIDEFKSGLKMGYKDIYIASADTGGYGLDIFTNLPELLEKMTEIEGDYKIFLGSTNPAWLVKYIDSLEEIFKKDKIKYLECPIQSGSNRILKLMNRYGDVDEIIDACKRLRNVCPDLQLSQNIMVGFPTETDEDFEASVNFIKETNVNGGMVFPCSCNPGTKAAEIEPKVPQEVILERNKYFDKSVRRFGYKMFWIGGNGVFYKKIKL